jgi:hypothetical protein
VCESTLRWFSISVVGGVHIGAWALLVIEIDMVWLYLSPSPWGEGGYLTCSYEDYLPSLRLEEGGGGGGQHPMGKHSPQADKHTDSDNAFLVVSLKTSVRICFYHLQRVDSLVVTNYKLCSKIIVDDFFLNSYWLF